MVWRVIEHEVVPTSKALGLGQLVFSPMAQGVLTGKYLPGQSMPEGSRGTTRAGELFMADLLGNEGLLTAVQKLRPLADAEGLTMAQMALAWVLMNDNVSSALAGASRPEQITEAAGAAEHRLSAETMLSIDEILADFISNDADLVADAEGWLGRSYVDLQDFGVESVTLVRGEDTVYGPMSLANA
ncbi:ABC transporter ATP-binding protein [Platysternon megacephalum]|uniref:ABC transporter ATP-binding protein n=1 Tax=Platysternon megacephalum TaxID=55544 RepID=A0A4D9DEL1_9SAUR|nr:ABC transporter ATP-binding protein [Platysternon megacephalum]